MFIFVLFVSFVVFSVIFGGMLDSDILFCFGVFGVLFLLVFIFFIKLFFIKGGAKNELR